MASTTEVAGDIPYRRRVAGQPAAGVRALLRLDERGLGGSGRSGSPERTPAKRWRGVFLPPEPELWDARNATRLTMLLDPGRIKRGLVPNLEFGYPLVEGTTISIGIDAAFRDATGPDAPGRGGTLLQHRASVAVADRPACLAVDRSGRVTRTTRSGLSSTGRLDHGAVAALPVSA